MFWGMWSQFPGKKDIEPLSGPSSCRNLAFYPSCSICSPAKVMVRDRGERGPWKQATAWTGTLFGKSEKADWTLLISSNRSTKLLQKPPAPIPASHRLCSRCCCGLITCKRPPSITVTSRDQEEHTGDSTASSTCLLPSHCCGATGQELPASQVMPSSAADTMGSM